MPTIFTHPAVPLAARALTGGAVTSRRLLVAGVVASIVPDFDALGYFAGVPYESLFGHRGLTHSLAFALLLATVALLCAKALEASRGWAFAFVFLSAASHGLLDAFTDGGLGIAFLSPFSNQRFFFPWRPIPVSPIGVAAIFTLDGARLLLSEIALLWLPCLLVAGAAWVARRFRRAGPARPRSGGAPPLRASVLAGAVLALAGVSGAVVSSGSSLFRSPPDAYPVLLADALRNLELQAAKLAARDGASCPQDFAALDGAEPLRISIFYGYDDHEGVVRDRVHAAAMRQVLAGPCRGRLSACGFGIVSESDSETALERRIDGRPVQVHLFTTSLPEGLRASAGLVAAHREQERLSRAARERFDRELVESDVVFYSGHSRLGGGMGFDDQSGVTTLVNSVLRRPLAPVLEALARRPTKLRLLGLFSCESERYFRSAVERANPSLALILTTGDIRYAPGEQASLGALESVLSRYCGFAFHDSMIAASEPDPAMTFLRRGR